MKIKSTFTNFLLILLTAVLLTLASCGSTSSLSSSQKELTFNPTIKHTVLPNGINLYVKKNSYVQNRISLRLVVKAGSAMEEDDQKGVAHFVEHLAFNGTKNFEKSQIVDYFEKIGMNFGSDLNAYTSFEQTVYMLEIPADNPSFLDTAVLILKDWASEVTFPQEELDKERGVVTEEWRLRQNLNGRISDVQCNILLNNSRFKDRLPIGDMNIIKNISRERVIDFYKKWYRPEFISIVAVGDCDESKLQEILTNVMSQIPPSKEKFELPVYSIPLQQEKTITLMQDPEQPYNNLFIFNPMEDFKPSVTYQDVKEKIILNISKDILSTRLQEITISPDAPWLYAAYSTASLTNFSNNTYAGIVPKDNQISDSLKKFFDEVDKFIDYGVSESELEQVKQTYLKDVELQVQNQNNRTNDDYASEIINYILANNIPLTKKEVKNIYSQILPQITTTDVVNSLNKSFGNRGKMLLLIAPESAQIPSETELKSLWTNYKNESLAAYDALKPITSIVDMPKEKGSIKKQDRNFNLGTKEYILSNGIKIITKTTSYESNYVYCNAISKGGYYPLAPEDYPNADIAAAYALYSGFNGISLIQLQQFTQAKNINFDFGINAIQENITLSGPANEIETFLQILNAVFNQKSFSDEAWQTLLQSVQASANSYGSQPYDYFNEQIRNFRYGADDLYHLPANKKYLELLNQQRAQEIYKQKFANPADFTFLFVGNFNEKDLLNLCCYYLGSLETSNNFEETVYKYYDFPKGTPEATISKGLEKQGYVFMEFGGNLPEEKDIDKSFKDSYILTQLQNLLDIKLREVIREDKSGSYGIGVSGFIDGYPERFYKFIVSFGCEPERKEDLAKEVINQIKKIQTEPIDDVYIQKLQETIRRNRETAKSTNDWWINRIKAEQILTYEPEWFSTNIDNCLEWTTAENLQEAAKKYLKTDNFFTVYLEPQK